MGYGRIVAIEKVSDLGIVPAWNLYGEKGARLGMAEVLGLWGKVGTEAEGFSVKTDEHAFLILISSRQSCCESWGYITSDDEFEKYIGRNLAEVNLTDVSLLKEPLEELEYLDGGGVQFVDFVTDRGVLQFAVYNAHNGYYGHSVLLTMDDEVLLDDVL